MIDTRLWGSTPFQNQNAWLDLIGMLDLWHRALAQHITKTTGKSYRTFPLGNGGGTEWLHAVQTTYQNAAQALGVAPPPDLESYDLNSPGDFASWTFIVSSYSRTLALSAGLL